MKLVDAVGRRQVAPNINGLAQEARAHLGELAQEGGGCAGASELSFRVVNAASEAITPGLHRELFRDDPFRQPLIRVEQHCHRNGSIRTDSD